MKDGDIEAKDGNQTERCGKGARTRKKQHKHHFPGQKVMFVLLNDLPMVPILHKDHWYWLVAQVGYADDLQPLDAYPMVADAENRPIAKKTFI